MAQRTTQCPECNTTFRVSDVHLQVAKGKVRCGSCLHVFKAEDYWVKTPAEEENPRPVTAVRQAVRPPANDRIMDDEKQDTKATAVPETDDDMFINLDDLGGKQPLADADKPELADESWAKDMLNELEDDSGEREARAQSLFHGKGDADVFADDDVRDGRLVGHEAYSRDEIEIENPKPRARLNRDEILSKVDSAPIEIAWEENPRDWASLALGSFLCLLGVLGLVLQFAWMNFENLARENGYRPLYAVACDIVGCHLPDRFNPAAINSTNLVVRQDPALPGALLVDAILQNQASYEQPFPDLELYFSDTDDFPVASRNFHPKEYLSGEMAGKTLMPTATTIHISLQLVDPGEKAVKYRLQISDKKSVNS
jgi:predicted Zn finger-like uncharacterized protein